MTTREQDPAQITCGHDYGEANGEGRRWCRLRHDNPVHNLEWAGKCSACGRSGYSPHIHHLFDQSVIPEPPPVEYRTVYSEAIDNLVWCYRLNVREHGHICFACSGERPRADSQYPPEFDTGHTGTCKVPALIAALRAGVEQ